MKHTPKEIGKIVRETRKKLGVTQKALALTSGTGLADGTTFRTEVATLLHATL